MERSFSNIRVPGSWRTLLRAGTGVVIAASLLVVGCNKKTTAPETGALFSSGNVGAGETFVYTFQKAGTFPYYCTIHQPDMKGTIVVLQGFGGPDTAMVTMENLQFHPQQDTVAPGTAVEWINQDNTAHTVTSGTLSSNSGSYY